MEVLQRFSFAEWNRFAEENFKAFPRYVRDQCLLALKYFDERTDGQLLEKAVRFCLTNQTYSMKDLADTYQFYEGLKDGEIEEVRVEDLGLELAASRSISVRERDLGEYTALLKGSAGVRS